LPAQAQRCKPKKIERASGQAMFRTLLISAVIMLLRCLSLAQAECSVEAKILLSPQQVEAAVASLNAGKETVGEVYFFDTASLDLLSQGVTVRLRRASKSDLTVKVRRSGKEEFSGSSGSGQKFKCEGDVVGGKEQRSYSIQRKFAAQPMPETGAEMYQMLSTGQRELLEQAHIATDWALVKRFAGIKSKSWRVPAQPDLGPMALELWRWPTGQVLELSARARSATGSAVYSKVQQLATSKGLALSRQQQLKTTMVLQAIAQGR
jgi:hypothetical protein